MHNTFWKRAHLQHILQQAAFQLLLQLLPHLQLCALVSAQQDFFKASGILIFKSLLVKRVSKTASSDCQLRHVCLSVWLDVCMFLCPHGTSLLPLEDFYETGYRVLYLSQPMHTNYYKIVKQLKSFKTIIIAPTCFALHKPSSGSYSLCFAQVTVLIPI